MLIGGAIIFRDHRGKRQFLFIKEKDSNAWEFPKIVVRKGESSVRAVIRLMGEQASISSKVLEEAGRYAASAVVNGKAMQQKYYYYLMLLKATSGEIIGLPEYKWLEYGEGLKKLEQKREKDIFKDTKEILKTWEKGHKNYRDDEDEGSFESFPQAE